MTEVPLPGHERLVSGVAEVLGQQALGEGQSGGVVLGNRRQDPEPHCCLAGHERGPRGAAGGLNVEAIEFHALSRQLIQAWGGDLTAVVPHIVPAKIVRQDDDDIGWEIRGEGELSHKHSGQAC